MHSVKRQGARCPLASLKQTVITVLAILWSLGQYPVYAAEPFRTPQGKEALQLATEFTQGIKISDYLVSEKLDGVRGRWDGQFMWSRGGKKILLPSWFTQGFPKERLDGELWIGRGRFESVSALVRTFTPDLKDWQEVRFMVFDVPDHGGTFAERYRYASGALDGRSPYLHVIAQHSVDSLDELNALLAKTVAGGGEGLMLHRKTARYIAGRNQDLMKLKPFYDAEARVIGYSEGKGKFAGMLGALLVETPAGIRFSLGSGMSVAERRAPPPIGSWITYNYLGVTAKGKPRFASFVRLRLDDK